MYRKFYISLLFLGLLSFSLHSTTTEPHHVTAYIGRPGDIDLLISNVYYATNHFWNKSGKFLPTYNEFRNDSTLLFAEYAISNRNSLTLNGGYSMVHESLNGNSCGWEDVELGWKSMLYRRQHQAFTAQFIAIIPAGDKKSSIRYGKCGIQVSLLCSDIFTLFHCKGWYDLEVGYRYYDGYPSDQLIFNLATGCDLFNWVSVIATGELLYGVNNGCADENFNNVIYHPNPRLLNGKVECVAALYKHLYLTIGVYKHLWGENIGAGGGCYAGLWLTY